MKVIVNNIQRFSLHDGPGIRTIVFFKGCNLKCPWCCNPEDINFNIESYKEDGVLKQYGKEMTLEELEHEILKDKDYYDDDNGGVTFSGGECLWQFEKIEPLLKKLKSEKINICIETALTVPEKYLDIALRYVDEFYVDAKILDETSENKINGNPKLYESNYKKLISSNKNVIVRIPVVKDYTYTDNNINLIINLLKKNKPNKVEIFKTHELAKKKYKTLNLKFNEFKNISNDELLEIKNKFDKSGLKCEIIKI